MEKESKMKQLEFDAKHGLSYGYYRCQGCGSTFYAGGKALHKRECSTLGYDNCVYVIGPKTVEAVKEWAVSCNEDDPSPNTGVTLNDIRQQLPNVL